MHDSNEVQWYYDMLQPWVHYIPVAKDFSNIEQNMVWAERHPIEAQAIADNGKELARSVFTEEQIMLAFLKALDKSNSVISHNHP